MVPQHEFQSALHSFKSTIPEEEGVSLQGSHECHYQASDYKDCDLTPLWHCFVLMKPQQKRKDDKDLPAWMKLEFVSTPGAVWSVTYT